MNTKKLSIQSVVVRSILFLFVFTTVYVLSAVIKFKSDNLSDLPFATKTALADFVSAGEGGYGGGEIECSGTGSSGGGSAAEGECCL